MRDSVADCTLILDYYEEHGWVDLPSPVMSQYDSSFLTILPTIQEDFRHYPHLVLVLPASNDTETLTQGRFTVTKILGWDQTKHVVYGGPGSNIISDKFSVDFHTYLVSKRHLVVARIDARGSSFRSKQQEFAVYRNLGRYEIEDQIAVVRYLTQRFQFIDQTKVGIWGWSYGGFDTAMVLATDKEGVFQCGVSVAPVTNFLYYDSIYTERYMGLPDPSDNEAGYNRTDVTRLVDNFANKSFLLMHGTADDNVHYQQSMMLTKAFEEKDIFFYQQSYPDQAHGIASYQRHVYHTINHFWTQYLGLHPGTV
ncbi:hypothetical protein WDU94_008402 [Cyamophila willieti]